MSEEIYRPDMAIEWSLGSAYRPGDVVEVEEIVRIKRKTRRGKWAPGLRCARLRRLEISAAGDIFADIAAALEGAPFPHGAVVCRRLAAATQGSGT